MFTAATKTQLLLASHKAFAKMSGGPNPVELARTTEMLGRAPRGYRAYVRDAVAARSAAPAAAPRLAALP